MKLDKSAVLVSAAALTSSLACAAQPNVVFILADDMGYGDVSALNEKSRIRTPAIDALCRDGVTFTDAHSGSSVSTPSRYGILTGRYAFRTTLKSGVTNSYSPPLIAPSRRTIATFLSELGYSTACIGKWHLGWNWTMRDGKVDFSGPVGDGPVTRGFDYFFGIPASLDMPPYVYIENDRVTAQPDRTSADGKGLLLQRSGPQGADFEHGECLQRITRKSLEYIAAQSAKKPFFLYMPLTAPHTPILPSEEFRGKSGLSPYGDFVMMVDDVVAQIVARLKEQGLYENTVVVFAADNGCFHGAGVKEMEAGGHFPSYIYRGYKSDLFDGGHRARGFAGREERRARRAGTGLPHGFLRHVRRDGRLPPHARRGRGQLQPLGRRDGQGWKPASRRRAAFEQRQLLAARRTLEDSLHGRFRRLEFPDLSQGQGVYRHASFDAALRPGERPRRDEKRDRRTPRRRAPSDRPDAGAYRTRTLDARTRSDERNARRMEADRSVYE